MEYKLPELSFDYEDLEPYIDAQTMRVHHKGHHKTYVDKLNAALAKSPDMRDLPLQELLAAPENIPIDVREDIRNNGGGHYNHSLFWQVLTPQKKEVKANVLAALRSQYGSFDNFKNIFSDVAAKHFGSGWAWLCVNHDSRLIVTSMANQDVPLTEGCEPLLLLDLWEHAYYLRYQNQRAEFIKAFWNIIDWDMVETLFMRAVMAKHKQIPVEARH